jgi:hypothetical protein
VVVTGGTASSAAISGNTLTVNMATANVNGSCVKVTLSGISTTETDLALANETLVIGVLRGDVTGDGQVLSGDVSQVKLASGSALNSTPNAFRRDLNLDGQVLSGDVTTVKGLSGNTMPPCP